MSGQLFQKKPLATVSFFQRLFKQIPQENAVIELNNLLAAQPVLRISQQQLDDIENRYQLKLNKEFARNLEEFYAVYLNHCLADKELSAAELNELQHLKMLLQLSDKTIDMLHIQIGEVIYRKSFEEAVADGRLTAGETAFLAKLENTLRLPKALAEKISAETRANVVRNYVAQILADERLSPMEEQELAAITSSLNITIELSKSTQAQLAQLKLYWSLENLPLPIVQADIAIQKTEICHLKIPNVDWYELRSVRQRTSYRGYSTSFKLAKGFYLRAGSQRTQSHSVDTMTRIDGGTLYLTNKRVIFMGVKKNSIIRIDKILDFVPCTDGVEIDKETGKSPTLRIAKNADIFCVMLERLLNER